MNDLRELYQTTILDHNRNPRNARRPEGATCEARGDNPLCGDQVTMYATVEDGTIRDVGFEGSGCAISTAAASMLTERVKGMSVEEFVKLFDRYHELVTAPHGGETHASELGKLAVFEGVREFAMRVKCATLAWHTLRSALAGGDSVSTE
jgi:nitrogen fixation NifU-like protein